MYNVQMVSTPHSCLEAASLGQLLQVGRACATHIQGQESGCGAFSCPSTAHSSTRGHIFLMTFPNPEYLSVQVLFQHRKQWKLIIWKLLYIKQVIMFSLKFFKKQMATLLVIIIILLTYYGLHSLEFFMLFLYHLCEGDGHQDMSRKIWTQPLICHHLQGISWLIRLSARITIDPFIDIVLICENLILPFKKMVWGYRVHVKRVKSEFGFIIGSYFSVPTLKQHLAHFPCGG